MEENEKNNLNASRYKNMNSVYIDTNVFMYLSDKKSPFYFISSRLIKYLKKQRILVFTSVETIQEIIHFSQNTKQLAYGIKTSLKTLETVDKLLEINQKMILNYLKLVGNYKNVESRDLLHLTVSMENNINLIISYDKDFKKFKEIKAFTPKEFLAKMT